MTRLSIAQFAGLGVLSVLAAACAGMTTATPEAQIMSTIGAWEAAAVAEDIDALMATYSDNFEHYEYGTKSTLRLFLSDLIAQGMLSGASVSLADMDVRIDGSTATAYPVDLEAAFGGATLEFVLREQASGAWLITSMDVQLY